MELVLSKEKCALISSAMDDCKIASCKDDDRNRVTLEGEIPFGAICRIKCRSVKATRCRCCKAGFEIGKKCPEDDELDGCGLEVDNFALYEGPDANLVPALDWRGCYQECLNRGMNCHAASFVKLRFNSMCWIFNEVTTRYGDEQDPSKDTFGGPTRELFGLRNGKIGRSGGGRKVPPVQNKPLFELPVEMRPVGPVASNTNLPADDGQVTLTARSGLPGFRQPSFGPNEGPGVSIAKGAAVNPNSGTKEVSPVMISWYRKCQV